MIKIFKTTGNITTELDSVEQGSWISLISPTQTEIEYISQKTGVEAEYLKAALDEEETSRIETEDETTCVIIDVPVMDIDNKSVNYYTLPLGILINDKFIITVCLKENRVIEDFLDQKVKGFFSYKKSRFILQLLYKVATYYLAYLKQIDKTSHLIESRLHKSLKNKELIQLLSLQKSLVYFSTSLMGNQITLEKMLKLEMMQKYEDDKDVLEDVIIENKQAIEMANIYSNILSGTMDAFASIISNNLNIVMKFLASMTIVLSVPSAVAAFFGMNVPVPFQNSSFGFPIVVGITTGITVIIAYVLAKKDMF